LKLRNTLALLVLGASCVGSVQAGMFDEDARREVSELRKQIDAQNKANDERFNRLDESIKSLGVIQLLQQIEMLNAELSKLRGQIEVLNYQNEQLQKRQRDFYVDLDTRMRRLEGGGAPPADGGSSGSGTVAPAPVAAATAKPPAPNPVAENKAYDAASNLFKKGDYARAVESFSSFLQTYPGSPLAANAQYWIGISHFNLKDYKNAQAAQESLIKMFPESPKVPDALLAMGSIQIEQGDTGSARNTLEDIIAKYPGTEAAGKARTRLAAIRR
jgi:tol-pal system protein YbgF